MRVAVLLNVEGNAIARTGPAMLRDELATQFASAGVEADIRLVTGREFPRAVADALAEPRQGGGRAVDAIVVGGGDGSISTAAGLLYGREVALGILPLGTLNHLAKDLGLPLDMENAVRVIASGRTRRIDVAEVNGRIFVNNSSLGFYPAMLEDRIYQQRRTGRDKWLAAVIAFGRVLRDFPVHRLTIKTAHGVRPRKTPCAFVGNNCYGVEPPYFGARTGLDRGELCIYIAHSQSRLGWLVLIAKALFRGLSSATDFEILRASSLEIGSRRHHLRVAADGELEVMDTPLRYRVHPRALRVLAPEPGSPT